MSILSGFSLGVPEFSPVEIIPTWENSIGLDAVLHEDTFLATSERELIPARKAYRTKEDELKKVSQRKSTKTRGSSSRRRLAKREARIHQKIARSRKDHHFKTAHRLTSMGKKVFFVEDLELKNLTKRNKPLLDENGNYLPNRQSAKSGLNKSFQDAGFGKFVEILTYIVAKTGGYKKPRQNRQAVFPAPCDANRYPPYDGLSILSGFSLGVE